MSTLELVHTTIGHADTLFVWRNDWDTYRYYLRPEPVARDVHLKWMHRTLTNPAVLFYVGEVDGVPVGSIRFDLIPGRYEVTIVVAPDRRGQGWGTLLLLAGMERARQTGARVIEALVHPQNEASTALFEACGYELMTKGAFNRYRYTYGSPNDV